MRVGKILSPRINLQLQVTTPSRTLTANLSLLPRLSTRPPRGLASAMPLEMPQLVPHQLEHPELDVKSKLQAMSEVCGIYLSDHYRIGISIHESILTRLFSLP